MVIAGLIEIIKKAVTLRQIVISTCILQATSRSGFGSEILPRFDKVLVTIDKSQDFFLEFKFTTHPVEKSCVRDLESLTVKMSGFIS